MDKNSLKGPVDIEEMMSWVSTILKELNVGLLVFNLQDPHDPKSLRLLYANPAASDYTGTDLGEVVGLPILEAFPALADSDLPQAYTEVVRNQKSLELGTTEYGDEHVVKGFYSVKAFPMPSNCVGVVFENITVRKKVEELVRRERQQGR